MLTLSTPSDQLMKELADEHEKAKYWLKKHYGGEQGYEAMRDQLLAKCQRSREPQTSDVVEYNSKNGNRWLCYEHAIYYPESLNSNTMPYAFCYYETAGSVGVFSPCFSADERERKPISCIIFTPHFFQRFAERLGIEMGGTSMARKFVECVPYMNLSQYEPDEDGTVRIDVRLPGSLGRGIRRAGRENVFEVRTFLADKQLSKAQLRHTSAIRDWGDKVKYEPKDMLISRMARQKDPMEAIKQEFERKEALGFDTSKANHATDLSLSITLVFAQMHVAEPTDLEFWHRHGENANDSIYYFLNREEDGGESFEFFKEYVSLACEIARKDGIRKFNKKEFARQALTLIWHVSEEEAEQVIKLI